MAYVARAHSLFSSTPEFPGFPQIEARESIQAVRKSKVASVVTNDAKLMPNAARAAESAGEGAAKGAMQRPNLALVQLDRAPKQAQQVQPVSSVSFVSSVPQALPVADCIAAPVVKTTVNLFALEEEAITEMIPTQMHWFNREAGKTEHMLWAASWLVLGLLFIAAI